MSTRHIVRVGSIVGILLATQGCSQSPVRKAHPEWTASPSAQQEPAENPQKAATPTGPGGRKVDQMDANAGTIEALTRKAEAYTSSMAPLILARPGPAPTPAPSKVRWNDPSDFSLSTTAPPVANDRGSLGVTQLVQAEPVRANQDSVPERTTERTTIASADPDLLPRAAAPVRTVTPTASSDAMLDSFSRRVKDYPRDVSAHLDLQLMQFLKDEPTPKLSDLSTLPPEDRELLTAILDGLNNFRNALRSDSNMLFSNKIKSIQEMSERLRTQADLMIPTIRLCSKVTTYGIYEPIEPARFAAGKDEQVIVYCEIANFASSLNDKQKWETRLTWDMTLYSEQGMSVWSDKTESVSDASRNRRHDFFVRKAITLPRTLPIGRYLLKVTIVDTQSNRVAEATTPLVVAAQ